MPFPRTHLTTRLIIRNFGKVKLLFYLNTYKTKEKSKETELLLFGILRAIIW